MSEEEAYKIFSEMTPDVLDYVFSLTRAYTEKDKDIERLKGIIKEVREYIEENCTEHGEGKWAYRTINADNILNILKGVDKE